MIPNAQRAVASQGALAAKAEYKRQELERTASWLAHRAAVEGDRAVPTYRVPLGRVRVRIHGTCPFCGGSMFDVHLPLVDRDRPHVSPRGDVSCLPCGRKVAELAVGGDTPKAVTCACGRQYPQYGECLPCRKREVRRRATRAYRERQRALREAVAP